MEKNGTYTLISLVLGFLLLFVLSQLSEPVLAQEDNVTVNVSIGIFSEITVIPTILVWTNLQVGQAGGIKYLELENTGSVNITDVYTFVDTIGVETNRPYTSDNPINYAAGGLIVLHNKSQGDLFYWVGRLEWNETSELSNINLTAISENSRKASGFYRNASNDYIWAAGNGTNTTSSGCNNTGAIFALEDDIDDGTTSTRSPVATNIVYEGGNSQWGFFNINRSTSPLYGQCVAVNASCTNIYIYKYDKRSGYNTCTNTEFLRDDNMVPGNTENLTVNIWTPRGIPAGNMSQAILTFRGT